MAMKFTPDQQRVIDLRNCNILVSAAAGSGKTAVLVQRIVELISDPGRGTDIDRLLIVTFTNAAAAQMRERITRALEQRAEQEPENEHIKSQLTLIHNARITTIHSFCLYLIRNHFNDIGLDPDFKTADEAEMKLLYHDVLRDLLEEKFGQDEENFTDFVEYFAYDGREKRLEELILKLYHFSMSYPWPEEWLSWHRNDYSAASWQEFEQLSWLADLKKTVQETLEECRNQVQETIRLCEEPDGPYMYAAALEADSALIEALLADSDFQLLYEKLKGVSFAKLAVKKDPSVSPEKREQAKKGRERVKGLISGLAEKYFYAPPAVWLADMQKAAPALQELVELVLLFMERLEEKKREKNLLDFHDMEHMALRILLVRDEDGKVTPSQTALEYRDLFDEILIDEYQDSNLVQEYLLQSISREDGGRHNRFMVGDVKQSIYKFRLARPELFMEKFDLYQKEKGPCIRVDLKQNFRSRHEVTDCVNDIFTWIMHRSLGGVEYDQDAALYPAAQFPDPVPGETPETGDPSVCLYEPEFLVALTGEDGESGKEREAHMIADRIRKLVGNLPVRDKETGALRPARYQDIVILLRSTSGWDEDFKRILEECGIPVFVTSKTGYFAATEVQTVLNFLKILNNPLQDIPMFGVLHSVIGGFSDAQIALLRAADETGKKKLYDCMKLFLLDGNNASVQKVKEAVRQELSEKCSSFLAFLQRFREYAVYLPIHNLFENFLEETGYLYTVSALPGGGQRRINVEMLLARAESFEQTSYSGLFHFVRYIEQLERYEIDYGEGGTADENADIVRIMSIHKSKGLEFPICFVAGLSKRFNRQDTMQPVIMDMDMGLAVDCVDSRLRTRRTTLKKNVLAHKLLADSLGEELRVLYVAMTRAEEKLILTASCKEDKAPADWTGEKGPGESGVKPGRMENMSSARLQEASGYYEILLWAWQASGRPVQCLAAEDFWQEELTQVSETRNAKQRLAFSDPNEYLQTKEGQELAERIRQRYAHENLAGLFVKTTVSELKKAGMQEEQEDSARLFKEEEVIPYQPRFIKQKEETVSGTARGNAYHRLLERFPFEKKDAAAGWTASEIAEVIREKRESKELSEEFASAVNPHKICTFLKSDLAERMRRAQKGGMLWREQPFVLGIPASQLKTELPDSETVLIQGIIDVYFEEDGCLVLADYKTDAVSGAEELVRRYQVQLDYYEQALLRLTGKRVKERIIYSFALEKEIVLKGKLC